MTTYGFKTVILSAICLFCGYCMYLLDNVSVRKEFFALQGDRNDTKEFTNKIQADPEKADTLSELSQDIQAMIRGIREKFIVARPLLSATYVACTDKTLEGIEDILCMPPPKFLPEYKNPCWYSENQGFNCLPYFQLIGCAKCASTDLFDQIISHPDILGNSGYRQKETMWWSLLRYGLNKDGGPKRLMTFDEYLTFFQKAAHVIHSNPERGYITGEGSPHDLAGNLGWKLIPQNQGLKEPQFITPHLIRHMNPDVKIINILRDPVERLFSDYAFRCKNPSVEGFHRGVVKSIQLLHACSKTSSLRTCLYDKQLYQQVIKLKVWHKTSCTSTEEGEKLESLDLERSGIVLSV